MTHPLDQLDMTAARLEREWEVTIQTPAAGLDSLLGALGKAVALRQGRYDQCAYIRERGRQRFRALAGSHAGDEGTVQSTAAVELVFSIPPDAGILRRVFESVFEAHVNEEPTIRVQELWGCRSHYRDDKDNPNRYWNRADAAQIHGEATTPTD